MIRVQLACLDDKIFADTGQLVPASKTFYIGFGTDPDSLQVVQVDLAAPNAEACQEQVGAWYGYGHVPGEIDAPGGVHKNNGSRPPGQPGNQAHHAYNKTMRAWADKTGFAKPDGKPGYRLLEKGGYYHSTALRQAYAGYLQGLAGVQQDTTGAAS